jgi:DNA-binding NarL/FixJ family response regulator
MRIIIADDNRPFREALKIFVEKELNFQVISECENGFDLVNNNKLVEADILLVDIEMPVYSGIEALKQIIRKKSWVKAIAITNYFEKAYLKDLVTTGFKGCVFKDSIYMDISKAIHKVHNGGLYFPKNILLK